VDTQYFWSSRLVRRCIEFLAFQLGSKRRRVDHEKNMDFLNSNRQLSATVLGICWLSLRKRDARETEVAWMWRANQWGSLECAEWAHPLLYICRWLSSLQSHSASNFLRKVWFRCTTWACWDSEEAILVSLLSTSIHAVAFQEALMNWEIRLDNWQLGPLL